MAGGMDLGTPGKGRRPLDAAINLVPFIDLMAVTISFLIATAIWTQVGRLQVTSSGGSDPAAERDETVELRLSVTPTELSVQVRSLGLDVRMTREHGGPLDAAKVREELERIKTAVNGTHIAVTVEASDEVIYDDLVRLVDTCAGAGLKDVTVAAAAG